MNPAPDNQLTTNRLAPRPPTIGGSRYGHEELAAVTAVLESKVLWRHQGSTVSEFEARVAARIAPGARALAVNSGTSALYLQFAALDLAEGARVAMPTFGFVSAATACRAAGLVPVFVPVDEALAIDVSALDDLQDVNAVLAVHPFGAACDIDGVSAWAARSGALVLEDAAQCFGGRFRGRPVGGFGVSAALSFQHFKVLSTGEGGMLLCRDDAVADRAALIHDAASDWTVPDMAARVTRLRTAPLNLRMSELEGALGLAQLDQVDSTLARLRQIHAGCSALLSSVAGVRPRPVADPDGEVGSHLVFHLPDRSSAERAAHALMAEGMFAGTLVGAPGRNRHWAGDWAAPLARCGMLVPDPEIIERDRNTLATAVSVPIDVSLDDGAVEETQRALEKVLKGS